MKKCKKILAIILSAILLLAVVPTSVFAEGVTIVDISIPDVEVIENYNGGWVDGYLDQEDNWVDEEWFSYECEPKNITVTYSDNSTEEYEYFGELQSALGEVGFNPNQTGQNPWKAGNSYTAYITFPSGRQFPYTVNVVENPVESVSVQPVEKIENYDGNMQGYWKDENEYVENAYYEYYITPEQITVEFKDGGSFVGDPNNLYDETGYDYNYGSDQSYKNQWGIGTHTAWLSVLGVETEYEVEVVENPIKSVTVPDIELIQNSGGNYDGYYDENDNWVSDAWYCYDVYPREDITIELKNGEQYTGHYGELCNELGYYYEYNSDQSYENQWGIGTHTAWFSVLGFKTEFNVNIIDTPIKSITVADITKIEGTGGYDEGYRDEDDNWVEDAWYRYEVYPNNITVELKEGGIYSGYYWEVAEELGYDYDYYSDQSYENQWGVGTHTATFSMAGYTTDYNVIIEEAPIQSIEVEDLEIIEGSHEYYSNEGYYSIYNHDLEGTITFKDGTTKPVSEDFYIDEESYSVDVNTPDQSGDNPWSAGNTYEAIASVMGVSTTFNVTITESPVESFVLEDVILYEGIDSDDYDDFKEYYVSPELSQVTLKDGTKGEIKYGDFVYDKNNYWVYCDEYSMQEEEPWEAGNTYEVTAYLLGKSATFNVTIKENPIEELQLVKKPDNTEVLYGSSLNLKGVTIRIKYIDGTYEDISINHDFTSAYRKEFEVKKIDRTDWLYIYDDFETVGAQNAEIELFGKTCQIPVTVKENLMESISIREDTDKSIIITVKNSDNTSYDMKVLDMAYAWYYDENLYDTSILTDKGQFYALFHVEEDSLAIEMYTYGGENYMMSNAIDSSDWFKASYYMLWNPLICRDVEYEIEDYNGEITSKNIDLVINLAFNLNDSTLDRVMNGDEVRDTVAKYFDVDSIDLTLSENYDAENDLYTYYDKVMGGGEIMKERPNTMSYKNGVWTVTIYPAYDREAVSMELNDDLQILSYSIKETGAELREENGVMYYYENGVKSTKTGLVEFEGKQMYINKGRFLGATGLVTVDGKKMYINKGYFTGASGLVTIDGNKLYINQGYFEETTALVEYEGKQMYINKGRFLGASGIVTIGGKKMYINKGYFTGASGLVTISGNKMYINQGYFEETTALVEYAGKQMYINKGRFLGASGLVTLNGKKTYINKGYFTGASGLVTISGKKMYINKGYFTGASGLVTISGKKMYINKGYFTGASGLVTISGKKMYINKGYFTGATGIVTIGGKKHYINKGYFTGASGKVKVGGKTYTVVNGIVK